MERGFNSYRYQLIFSGHTSPKRKRGSQPVSRLRFGLVSGGMRLPGEHTRRATPVPIPNTAVKPPGPMVVLPARESVIAGDLTKSPRAKPSGFLRLYFAAMSSQQYGHTPREIVDVLPPGVNFAFLVRTWRLA